MILIVSSAINPRILALFAVPLVCLGLAGCPAQGFGFAGLPRDRWRNQPTPQERVSASVIRVDAVGLPSVRLGSCADSDASVLAMSCADSLVDIDKKLAANLDHSGFRYYNQNISATGSGSGIAGGTSSSTSGAVQKMRLIMEWARWRTQRISSKHYSPLIGAADVGVAVRVSFDVTLTNFDAKFSGGFGFGALATALATNSATIEARIRSVGIQGNLLPSESPTIINNVETYAKLINSFYAAIRELSIAYAKYAHDAGGAVAVAPAPAPLPAVATNTAALGGLVQVNPVAATSSTFSPDLLSYYVANLDNELSSENLSYSIGFSQGTKAVASGWSCNQLILNLAATPSFLTGVRDAYSTYTQNDSCDDSAPPQTAINQALVSMQGI